MSSTPSPVPFSTTLKSGARQILSRDKARAQGLLAGLHAHGPTANPANPVSVNPIPTAGNLEATANSVDVTDSGQIYLVPVAVGNPKSQYNLVIDAGSANTWIRADKYIPTRTSQKTGETFTVIYPTGKVTGNEFIDQVSLGGGLVIPKQSIGVATKATGFDGFDGVLGIGPVGLSFGTVEGETSVPTVIDNLSELGVSQLVGISYNLLNFNNNIVNGEMTFGSTDPTKFNGDINYISLTATSPANHYWGINQTLTYGSDVTLLDNIAGIVDTGITLLLLATEAFDTYQQATGGVIDQQTGLLTVTEQQFEQMQSLFFNIGGKTIELIPNAQIWPRKLNNVIGGEEGKIYLIAADLGWPLGTGLDFINGFTFLGRLYSVYDTTNKRVGIAETQFTSAEIN